MEILEYGNISLSLYLEHKIVVVEKRANRANMTFVSANRRRVGLGAAVAVRVLVTA